jgi:hypothetical protein
VLSARSSGLMSFVPHATEEEADGSSKIQLAVTRDVHREGGAILAYARVELNSSPRKELVATRAQSFRNLVNVALTD